MQLIDGRALATKIRQEVKEEIKRLGITPGLAVILVGDDPASHLYVSLKEKAAQEAGIHFEKHVFRGNEPQNKILETTQGLNERNDIHGMLVQVPLPKGYNEDILINQIDPKKDVDGFTQANLRAILSGEPRVIPAVALAIVALVDETNIDLTGKKAVLIVNRTEFAAPIEFLLEERGALVHIMLRAKEITKDIAAQVRGADIVVVARGRAEFLKAEMFKEGAVVIDVGTNQLPDGRVVGDVAPEGLEEKNIFITPVPGGVGPMTVAMLLKNTLELAKLNPLP